MGNRESAIVKTTIKSGESRQYIRLALELCHYDEKANFDYYRWRSKMLAKFHRLSLVA